MAVQVLRARCWCESLCVVREVEQEFDHNMIFPRYIAQKVMGMQLEDAIGLLT